MTDAEFNAELLGRLHELVTPTDFAARQTSAVEARGARKLIRALTPLRATVPNGRDLIEHPSIPVGHLGGDAVVGGWLSIINGLCGPNADIQMAMSPGRIDFTLNTYGPGDGEEVDGD